MTCSMCGRDDRPMGRHRVCKPCIAEQNAASLAKRRQDPAWRAKEKARNAAYRATHLAQEAARRRRLSLQQRFGISEEDYDTLLETQNGVCAICQQPETERRQRRLSTDHNHETGQVRGLLCSNCNTGLGKFKDDVELLKRALEYLGG